MPRLPTSVLSAQAPTCTPTSDRFLPVVDVNGTLYYSSRLPVPVHLYKNTPLVTAPLSRPTTWLNNNKQ